MASNLVLNPKFIYKSDELDILGFIIECVATAVTLTRISQLAIMLHAWRTTWEDFTVFSLYYPRCLCFSVSINGLHSGYFSLTQKLCKLFILFLLRPNYLIMLSALNDKFDQLYVVLFGDPLILGSAYFTETEFFFCWKYCR